MAPQKKPAPPPATQPDTPPTDVEIADVLGDMYPAFQEMAAHGGKASAEWKQYSPRTPWVLKVSLKKRSLFYARPVDGVMHLTVLLGDRAVRAALDGRVRKSLHAAIEKAKVYPEGRPVEVRLRKPSDLAGARELIAVKAETK
jgi:hypothetical protein